TNTNLEINGNLILSQGTLDLNARALTLRGEVQGNGMLAGSALSDLTIEGNGPLGTLNFQAGTQVLRNLTLDRKTSGTVNLASDLTINNTATLANGIVNMGASLLTFADNATVTGASDNSFVNGIVVKNGNDAFVFPVGEAGYYSPLAISAPASVTDQFTAEYIRNNPQTVFGADKEPTLTRVSQVEYWNLNRTNGTSDVLVNISYQTTRSAGVGEPNDLRVARFNAGTGWSDEGIADLYTGDNAGSLRTASTQSSYGIFTLGSVSSLNPLPVELTLFKATAKTKVVDLTWETASEMNSDRFEVERSSDARNFETIATVNAQGNSNTAKRYASVDENPKAGTSYYRLKQIDRDGTFAYSKVVAVQFASAEQVVRMYPNPARERMTIAFAQEIQGELRIMNAIGQTVKIVKLNQAGSNSELELNLTDLPAGTYHLRVMSNSSNQSYKFVKMN
ncbi:MAG TPA: T9SS type A sorting domain-containing protein, partial [Adhaeribacter sp.]|nr:T9SS type A sorting domain-containing protein [Adhaeribacter sp.]